MLMDYAVPVLLAVLTVLSLILVFRRSAGHTGSADEIKKIVDQIALLTDRQMRQSAYEFKTTREELAGQQGAARKELSETLENFRRGSELSQKQLSEAVRELREKILLSLQQNIRQLQDSNERKLDQMRETVDEKLHKTLETRLSQSFETVTKQLVEVQKGLSEMQSLAQDVGGLKKVLTNVKSRGVLGEAQLDRLLQDFLTAGQYDTNVVVKPLSKESVEFAIRLPGSDEGAPLWLPIDSKFPVEDFHRLLEAYESGEKPEIEIQRKALEKALLLNARTIHDKYIEPPVTTDFALMFLPFESLYAEALRITGLFEKIQHQYHVTIVGPSNLVAFLNSLQVGFKTLAISRQSGEVWKVLGAVRTEFGRFGEAISSVQKNLAAASTNLDKVSVRARQMERKLKDTTALPMDESRILLGGTIADELPYTPGAGFEAESSVEVDGEGRISL